MYTVPPFPTAKPGVDSLPGLRSVKFPSPFAIYWGEACVISASRSRCDVPWGEVQSRAGRTGRCSQDGLPVEHREPPEKSCGLKIRRDQSDLWECYECIIMHPLQLYTSSSASMSRECNKFSTVWTWKSNNILKLFKAFYCIIFYTIFQVQLLQ